MPICPKCNASIHLRAEDFCPVCGYSLKRADAVFGANQVEFTRVVDAAGALTHSDRMGLISALEDLERKLPPIVLCIYITDHGDIREFRSHAHWILNHAHIHYPSFGKREKSRAIEDSELTERRPGDPVREGREHSGTLPQIWQSISEYIRHAAHPVPPPVRQEWMLMLVLDVQLEMACFSWGYMLDPYIDVDRITSCIIGAKLQFRERAMVTALKLVMKRAVAQIARGSHAINKNIKRSYVPSGGVLSPLLVLSVGLGALISTPVCFAATAAQRGSSPIAVSSGRTSRAPAPSDRIADVENVRSSVVNQLEDDDVAEEVEDMPPGEKGAQAPLPVPEPAPKQNVDSVSAKNRSDIDLPQWSDSDYKLLMEGKLSGSYNLLITKKEGSRTATQSRGRSTAGEESNTKVPGRYCAHYSHPEHLADLYDPQLLLSSVEREDVEHVLREMNAHAPFRIYVSLFKEGQEIPPELSAATLSTAASRPCEYAVMVQYSIGDNPVVALGYKEIQPTEAQVHEWASQAQQAAFHQGGGVEGLLAAVSYVHEALSPIAASFPPLSPEAAGKVRLIELPRHGEQKVREPSSKEKFQRMWENISGDPVLYIAVVAVLLGSGISWLYFYFRQCGKLLDTPTDYRLASPYGASVSRYVRYLEGKEAAREKKIFADVPAQKVRSTEKPISPIAEVRNILRALLSKS